MDVRHLELLRELADRGSVTAVAEASHRTVSAVSQQLRTAQREFGMRLVEPAGRGVRLTEAGRLLAAGAVQVQTAVARVQQEWDAYRNDPGGAVSVLAFPSAASIVFPAIIGAAAREGIGLRLADRDLAEADFAASTADFDIVIAHSLPHRRPVGTADLVVEHLAVEPLDIVMSVSHPLAAKQSLRAADVADASWIGVPDGYPFDVVLSAIAERVGAPLDIQQRLCDNRVTEQLVRAGDLLAVLPRFTTVADEGITLREITDVPAQRTLSAILRPDRAERRAVQAVLASVTAALDAERWHSDRSVEPVRVPTFFEA